MSDDCLTPDEEALRDNAVAYKALQQRLAKLEGLARAVVGEYAEVPDCDCSHCALRAYFTAQEADHAKP